MLAQETFFLKARNVFDRICQFLCSAAEEGQRMDQVERELKTLLAEQGLSFLEEYVQKAGNGDQGETVTTDGHVLKRSATPQRRRYLSIFGEMSIFRYVYSAGEKKPIEYAPLDSRLGLPAGEISYVLEDYQQRLCVQNPYAKSTEDLKAILGVGVPVGTAERMNQQMAAYASSYRALALSEENTPPPDEEGELLVAVGDGKGVPMRRSLEERLQAEREAAASAEAAGTDPTASASRAEADTETAQPRNEHRRAARKTRQRRQRAAARAEAARGSRCKSSETKSSEDRADKERKGRKQMAYVGAVYTIARFPRTAEDVLDEVARRRCQEQRPRPQHKRVWGEMTQLQEGESINGRSLLFAHLAFDCHARDRERKKTLICLMDGEEPLWEAKEQWLSRGVEILDFFHALERLWKVARLIANGNEAEAFVTHHAQMLLEGKVNYVVRNFGRLIKDCEMPAEKREEVLRAIGYFRHNRSRMRYDEFLAAGYPIGSGVAEGTCRNLVKDRLELTGMKWEHAGARAMIYLRALYLNDEWNDFVAYRVEREQEKLYGSDTVYAKLSAYGQAA
jgi:hypothetical protein